MNISLNKYVSTTSFSLFYLLILVIGINLENFNKLFKK